MMIKQGCPTKSVTLGSAQGLFSRTRRTRMVRHASVASSYIHAAILNNDGYLWLVKSGTLTLVVLRDQRAAGMSDLAGDCMTAA
jgi:hypothetical protein